MARSLASRARRAADQWRRFGQVDPYYGVVSDERFRRENIAETARQAFFGSGRT